MKMSIENIQDSLTLIYNQSKFQLDLTNLLFNRILYSKSISVSELIRSGVNNYLEF